MTSLALHDKTSLLLVGVSGTTKKIKANIGNGLHGLKRLEIHTKFPARFRGRTLEAEGPDRWINTCPIALLCGRLPDVEVLTFAMQGTCFPNGQAYNLVSRDKSDAVQIDN